ncbi:MAG: uroporphyrinogen-III C-methyltransferase [Pirellulales bacterium]|jgi:uroporphyrinogen III methyltransferase/synthase|nr:uroporphyrinogen-III C-methyltransferase [Thermoguttaceae bacterium]MDD4788426.1 uroporphyrinogen-III C-methyltransferase [Pirellulales bacterium]MDI9445611.1 uroporphyrinogen-III C-methyltransferase [Planctomycetota bacterium]NLY98999.1 uroporphyrinogen-III C-methyltransferase [Pirellulaceae bacterium]
MIEPEPSQTGHVYLVGAGPGDPGLLTLRGMECLARAELVLYDYLVNPAVLAHARESAELVCLGHHRQCRRMDQGEVNRRMIQAAAEGRIVVRLKGGDPGVFGHAGEETAALRAAGISYEIVPGVTAVLAAAGCAEIPITHGEHSSSVALVTGQERRAKASPALDYGALAMFPGTLVFYMGIRSAAPWSEALIRRGKPEQTPVAIVRRCSLPDQLVVRCTLGTVADVIREQKLRPPAVIIVGPVAAIAPDESWFSARPLFGRTVLVTRPRRQAASLCNRFAELGARVLVQPMIEIAPPPDWAAVDDALDRLEDFDWLVFSSANGVRCLLQRVCATRDLRRLGSIRLAAIGPGTSDELAAWRLRADLVPGQYRAEALAEALADQASGKRFLLARASRGREVLAERLEQAGGRVEQVVVYSSNDVARLDPEVKRAAEEGRIDWITLTSSAIARSAVRWMGRRLGGAKPVTISPITSSALRDMGGEPAAEATEYTIEGVVRAVLLAEMGGMPG